MIKRPKPGEDEEDILRMQEEFLNEKKRDHNHQPAAQVVNLRGTEATKRSNEEDSGTRKPSKFAQSKGLKSNLEKRARIENHTGSLMGDIFEKNLEEPRTSAEVGDNVYYPKVLPSVLGGIVEKNVVSCVDFNKPMLSQGFPIPSKRDNNIVGGKKSIHRLAMDKKKNEKFMTMEVDQSRDSVNTKPCDKSLNLPSRSYLISAKEAEDIHKENITVLKTMTEKEILEERNKLLTKLDPKLVEFIEAKRKNTTSSSDRTYQSMDIETPKDIAIQGPSKYFEPTENTTVEKMETNETFNDDSLWDNDIFSHPDVHKWLHFETLEKDKFEWMKGIEDSKKIKPDEAYEARFDFKGYLLPYTLEYKEETKSLFHHGEEPHRPGYSLTELIELSRSTVTQQRVMALNTIAGILDYYNAGTYKDILEIPLSKIMFVVRIAVDENKVIILEPALKALRNMIYNRVDEACLDALIGFEEGTIQPCLENDKFEIEELDSKESELKDFHLAEIDIITALLRTDIIQRLYYILEFVKPSFNCVHYALQILTRLARDSVETAKKLVETEHLMNVIIKYFMPTTTLNFVFSPQIVYKRKPLLAAVKLFRVLSLQTREISKVLLIKYNILKPISEYISSAVDRTYGLRIQIEALALLSNFLHFDIGMEAAVSLGPVIVTSLYKHVQGSSISAECSVLSVTHAALILQLIKDILNGNKDKLNGFKDQIYPLLKEGTSKWIAQLCNAENYTCAHLRLYCSIFDCCKTIIVLEKVQLKFLNDYLKHLSVSRGFQAIIKNLVPCSNLLSGIQNKDLHLTKNLVSLGTTVIDSPHKVLPVFSVVSPIPFLGSLFSLLTYVEVKEISEAFLKHLPIYISKLAKSTPSLCDNWFTRMETDLVFNIIKLYIQNDASETNKGLLYTVANKLCYILRNDKKCELRFLFNNIVFNKNWFTAERLMNLINLSDAGGYSKALTLINNIKECYTGVVSFNSRVKGPNVVLKEWSHPILPRDWIYLPILVMYSENQDNEAKPKVEGQLAKRVAAQMQAKKEVKIACTLEWILFNELCFSDQLNDISVTDRFCRIMCVFLCDNSVFLNENVNVLLRKCTQVLFKHKSSFDFDKPLIGLHNFQDFYTQFLEQFQAVSYGDCTFAACVLVPLAQRHNAKWRKLLWSEYAGCLRALDCPEEYLCYDINEYLYPEETDVSLIMSYSQALSSNLLRPGTLVYKIATHHVQCYKNRSNMNSDK